MGITCNSNIKLMNIFRFIADSLHLLSFIILISKIRNTRNCLGLSYKTQEIYLVVFIARYWDLFLYFISLYNSTMKILYISSTIFIIFLIKFKKPYCLVITYSLYSSHMINNQIHSPINIYTLQQLSLHYSFTLIFNYLKLVGPSPFG